MSPETLYGAAVFITAVFLVLSILFTKSVIEAPTHTHNKARKSQKIRKQTTKQREKLYNTYL